MRKYLPLKLLGIICLASFLQVCPTVLAQDDDDFGGTTQNAKDKNEEKVLNDLFARLCTKDEKLGEATLRELTVKGKKKLVPSYFSEGSKPEDNPDPFRPIIRKEVVKPPTPVVKVEPRKIDNTPKQKPIEPIKIVVKGIVGNEGGRLAIVDFENDKDLTLTKDQIVEGKFKVVDIFADRVIVYSNKEQRRHTFKIHGEEG